ncbi:ribosomal large subunit pseudouridine synthase [Candidatus Photodesmus katoptron]|uniref:23S rRNA pseudouridine(955/2504/2580) synthase RluC n=1 Tax=Candidatus Photodesmus anomalopis TaxID=28176 RepID=UPI0004D7CCD7|nr:23S rRNA pseudouridine(955/2504/2580) synthase RluC [Candidatus Photodesmus katoptron]KEY90804.1 ribosomal large subunit pseudouridine synthase [Candidatus Photodesmus katoptron]
MKVQFIKIDNNRISQRIDNFLCNYFKKIPKSTIYRIIRKGEVRVNKKRIKPKYKLQINDLIRIPPIRSEKQNSKFTISNLNKIKKLKSHLLLEDDHIMVLNKPSGTAVHGGSGLSFGIIESLRALYLNLSFLELVHRIDRDTSGILLIAKKRSALRSLQEQFRQKTVKKFYSALMMGKWDTNCKIVNAPLLKNKGNGVVHVDIQGKPSKTHFKIIEQFSKATLIQATPITGRTHQIRVHSQYVGHPIAFDSKYGSLSFNSYINTIGLDRLFLHASRILFIHPKTKQWLEINAPMEDKLKIVLRNLRKLDQNSRISILDRV